jgi:regulator of sigma E protease
VTAFISIVSFLAVIIVLVLAHEFGHFITARMRGVRIEEFGIGFPPRVFGIKRGETIYSINAIPLGGFVKLAGEEDPKVTGSLAGKSIPTRILVLSAGVIMNLLLPFLLFSIAYMVPHQTIHGTVIIEEVSPASPAAEAGILPGDTLLSVNGKNLTYAGELSRMIQLNLGKATRFTVLHTDGTTETLSLIPRWRPPEGEGSVGVLTRTGNATVVRESFPFWKAIPYGARSCVETLVLFKNGIISMIIGTTPAQFTGPVGIAQLTGEVASAGISPLLEFAAFLSINLGIFNIFPLPGLDGGRIAFVLLEWIRRGKRVPPRIEGMVHLAGFALMIIFFIALTYQDIARIVSGGSLIP